MQGLRGRFGRVQKSGACQRRPRLMHEGKIIYDVSGEEKKKLQVSDLLEKFEQASGGEFANDRMMLA